jgi:LPS-assembly protein
VDYRRERGLAGGPDVRYDYGSAAGGGFSFYHAEDRDPGEDLNGDPIDRERQRFRFTHRTEFTSNLVAKAAVRYQSDPFVVRDFFETEYRNNVQPNSFLEVNQFWPDYSLNVFAQPQVNDFFETVERLPDVKFSAFRQQIGVTPLYYEGDSSLGYFRRRFVTNSAPDFEAVRGDSYHQVVWPRTHFGWLNFTPRVGGRYTYYGETDGPGGGMNELHRGVFNTGAELSFKASRVWRGARSRMFEVDELRHILEPSLNYVFVPEPNRRPPELPQFDHELDSLRLLPIDFPDYNAIDSIDSRNVLRLGLRNKLQTIRRGEVDNLLNWAVYTDWRLDRQR